MTQQLELIWYECFHDLELGLGPGCFDSGLIKAKRGEQIDVDVRDVYFAGVELFVNSELDTLYRALVACLMHIPYNSALQFRIRLVLFELAFSFCYISSSEGNINFLHIILQSH